jgi:hypothetical protein
MECSRLPLVRFSLPPPASPPPAPSPFPLLLSALLMHHTAPREVETTLLQDRGCGTSLVDSRLAAQVPAVLPSLPPIGSTPARRARPRPLRLREESLVRSQWASRRAGTVDGDTLGMQTRTSTPERQDGGTQLLQQQTKLRALRLTSLHDGTLTAHWPVSLCSHGENLMLRNDDASCGADNPIEIWMNMLAIE